MNATYFEQAIDKWSVIVQDTLEFGKLALLAIEQEGKTIRDFSIAICGNTGLEDRIGRYVQAAEFHRKLNPQVAETVDPFLTTSHYTELAKIENVYDHEYAIEKMQELVTEGADGHIDVKPVEWLRGWRASERSTEDIYHRLWMWAAKALPEAQGELERLGRDATRSERRRVRVLKLVLRIFAAEMEKPR